MSTQADIARATKWNREHRERRREISRKSWRKIHGDPETELERFERCIERITESGCWIWNGSVGQDGYGKTSSKGKDIRAHRWAWKLFMGEIPSGIQVCHRCDVPTCCNPHHLFLGTPKENTQDMWKKGRRGPMRGGSMPGEKSQNCIFTDADIKRMHEVRLFSNCTNKAIAKYFWMSQSHLSHILRGDVRKVCYV